MTIIPIIDFEGFNSGSLTRRQEVIDDVDRCASEIGFMYAKNLSVDNKLIQSAFESASDFFSFPIDKREISIAILRNKKNIKKINKIVHAIVRLKMENFLKKNKKSSFVILYKPLLLENKINKKKDILVFVDADKKKIIQTLKKRLNFNKSI